MAILSRFLAFLRSLFSLSAWKHRLGRFSGATPSSSAQEQVPVAGARDTKGPVPAPTVVRQYEDHPCPAYMDLKLRFRDIGRTSAIAETMGRDFLTAMPEGAWRSRLTQISFLHRRMHEDLTDPEVGRTIEEAASHLANHRDDWDEWDAANLREMEKLYRRHARTGGDAVEREAELAYEGRRRHRDVLKSGDWEAGRDFLSRTIDMKRQVAETICLGLEQDCPYQALVGEFMSGIEVTQIEEWFNVLEEKMSVLLPKVLEKQANDPEPLDLTDFYPARAQMWLNEAILAALGFDFERGGLYETGHNPVEGGTPEDTRLVIKNVDIDNFLDSFKSALHEGGHGLYIQGLPRKTWRYQPVGQDMGAAVHESQALLVDMIIGRTREFFTFISPRVQGLFHGLQNPVLSMENLHQTRSRVKPGLFRRSADELTYFFHVLLRFRLEKDLIRGDLKIAELPDAWAAGMEKAFGLRPENHGEGCLQDVHWFVGKFGYFPAYTVGHMMAAQQFAAIERDIPGARTRIASGDFAPITGWLRANIHEKGRLLDTDTLIKQATGSSLSPKPLLEHLHRRYMLNSY